MRGYKDFNFPAFHEAARKLRSAGHEVFSPAERDEEMHGADVSKSLTGDLGDAVQKGFSLREALADDLAWICLHAQGIALLPGWERSKGARAEKATADALGLPAFFVGEEIANAA